jgi:hypothetical protein
MRNDVKSTALVTSLEGTREVAHFIQTVLTPLHFIFREGAGLVAVPRHLELFTLPWGKTLHACTCYFVLDQVASTNQRRRSNVIERSLRRGGARVQSITLESWGGKWSSVDKESPVR